MAEMLRVRFLKAHGAYPEGHEEPFYPDVAAELSALGVVELLDQPPTPEPTAGDGDVEYSGVTAKLEQTIAELRDKVQQQDEQIARDAARIAELEKTVADYAAGTPAEQPKPSDPAEAPSEPAAAQPNAPAEPVDLPEAAASTESWRSKPVAGLNIPSAIKAKLMTAGIATAGDIDEALKDGRVLSIEGIGEAKAEDLRAHLTALAG